MSAIPFNFLQRALPYLFHSRLRSRIAWPEAMTSTSLIRPTILKYICSYTYAVGQECPAHTVLLAAPTRASTAHALIATAVTHHDRAADVASGRVSQVDHLGKGISSVDGRACPWSLLVGRWQRGI